MTSALLDEDLKSVLAIATDGASVSGENRRIILWNEVATTITGYPETEALGRACCDLFADHDTGRTCSHDPVMTPSAASVRSFDVHTTTKAGRPLWLHVTVFPVQGWTGATLVVHLFRDVTQTRTLVAVLRNGLSSGAERKAAVSRHGPLTRRQIEVLRLAALGVNTATIADRLHISRATVRNHVQNVFWKLDVHNRLQAVAYAARHGLL